MFKFYKILFFNSMIIGTLIAISSYSWLSMWMGLEINLLSIIPLLSSSKNLYPSEAALKYFIIQTLASSILLFSIILSLNFKNFLNIINPFSLMINMSFLIKMGAAPFHSWFPEVMEGLNWFNNFLLMTWQKIAPMILFFYHYKMSIFILMIILLSSLISGILGLNQISMRKILSYSSINHISWMLAGMLNNQFIWLFYFLIYSLISLNIIFIFYNLNIFYLTQLFSLNLEKTFKISILFNFFSLGGLPPFLGFFPKWLVISNLISNNFYFLSMNLIIFTLISLFFYLRISFSTLMINSNEILIIKSKIINFSLMICNFISLVGLIFCTMIFNFI